MTVTKSAFQKVFDDIPEDNLSVLGYRITQEMLEDDLYATLKGETMSSDKKTLYEYVIIQQDEDDDVVYDGPATIFANSSDEAKLLAFAQYARDDADADMSQLEVLVRPFR